MPAAFDFTLRKLFKEYPVLFEVVRSVNDCRVNNCYQDESDERVLEDVIENLEEWKAIKHDCGV